MHVEVPDHPAATVVVDEGRERLLALRLVEADGHVPLPHDQILDDVDLHAARPDTGRRASSRYAAIDSSVVRASK